MKALYLHKTLKMKLRQLHKLLFAVLLAGFYGHAQTVFLTREIEDTQERKGLFSEVGAFSNFSFSAPFRANPAYGTNDPYNEGNGTWFIPDGINIQGGFGVHATKTIALSINSGIDGLISPKLVAVPVYASIIINPHLNEDTSLFLQAGVGHSFALGRGDLSGLYQKYRVGVGDTEGIGFFIEANYYGFGLYDIKQISSLNLGFCIFNFN